MVQSQTRALLRSVFEPVGIYTSLNCKLYFPTLWLLNRHLPLLIAPRLFLLTRFGMPHKSAQKRSNAKQIVVGNTTFTATKKNAVITVKQPRGVPKPGMKRIRKSNYKYEISHSLKTISVDKTISTEATAVISQVVNNFIHNVISTAALLATEHKLGVIRPDVMMAAIAAETKGCAPAIRDAVFKAATVVGKAYETAMTDRNDERTDAILALAGMVFKDGTLYATVDAQNNIVAAELTR